MSMLEAFIGNLDKADEQTLDMIESAWFCTYRSEREVVICAIINEKLLRSEKEY